ncbi:MAG: hypothetical protein H8E09_00150 [Gammaproteobacteria bacterium]|nr:hypothetical protein [Gammaproteobacteria bacterium]
MTDFPPYQKNYAPGWNDTEGHYTTTDNAVIHIKCPRCGCQTRDPFGMGKVIHDPDRCETNGLKYV